MKLIKTHIKIANTGHTSLLTPIPVDWVFVFNHHHYHLSFYFTTHSANKNSNLKTLKWGVMVKRLILNFNQLILNQSWRWVSQSLSRSLMCGATSVSVFLNQSIALDWLIHLMKFSIILVPTKLYFVLSQKDYYFWNKGVF